MNYLIFSVYSTTIAFAAALFAGTSIRRSLSWQLEQEKRANFSGSSRQPSKS